MKSTQPQRSGVEIIREMRDNEWDTREQPPATDDKQWTVQERPSGLHGEGLPATCLQIVNGEIPITHGLEITPYNQHLLQEACDAHNAALKADARTDRASDK